MRSFGQVTHRRGWPTAALAGLFLLNEAALALHRPTILYVPIRLFGIPTWALLNVVLFVRDSRAARAGRRGNPTVIAAGLAALNIGMGLFQ